jgi:type IV pilus assembly protein PilV
MSFGNKQRGVSLIEVLITLILISIGLLGTAALQVFSKQGNYEAAQRTSAAHLANDLFQRMRSNRLVLEDYLPGAELGAGSLGTSPAKDCGTGAGVCTSTEIADYDLWHWEQQLDGATETVGGVNAGGLLEPTVCIDGEVGGGDGLYEVAIAWRGQAAHVNPTINNCGEGSGKYGDDDEFRHVLIMQTFIQVGL